MSQIDIHAEYGGVIPEIAARSHIEAINPVINKALRVANTDIDNIEPQQPAARKFILNGQLFIEIDGRVYNIMGQEVSIE